MTTDDPHTHVWRGINSAGQPVVVMGNGDIEVVERVDYDEPRPPMYYFKMDEEEGE